MLFSVKVRKSHLGKKLILIFVNSIMSSRSQMENNKIIACIIHKTMKCKETHSRYDLHLQKDLSANFSAFTKKKPLILAPEDGQSKTNPSFFI